MDQRSCGLVFQGGSEEIITRSPRLPLSGYSISGVAGGIVHQALHLFKECMPNFNIHMPGYPVENYGSRVWMVPRLCMFSNLPSGMDAASPSTALHIASLGFRRCDFEAKRLELTAKG